MKKRMKATGFCLYKGCKEKLLVPSWLYCIEHDKKSKNKIRIIHEKHLPKREYYMSKNNTEDTYLGLIIGIPFKDFFRSKTLIYDETGYIIGYR